MDAMTDLLAFWFDERAKARWFDSTPEFDQEIRDRFGDLARKAADGELKGWETTAQGALALCLLLDQLPRHMYRGKPEAYATDDRARAIAERALNRGFDKALPMPHRMFLYLPFEHSEELADQDRAVALFEEMGDPELVDWAKRHRKVIQRFGRFPHRNKILGRESTPEERAFLEEANSSF